MTKSPKPTKQSKERVKKVFIHKNYLKKYWRIRPWVDVPEFAEFTVVPQGWVQIVEEK